MWRPRPVDTTDVRLPDNVAGLVEQLAEHAHDTWAVARLAQGWSYGRRRSRWHKRHPCLVAYADLPESEKQLDRDMAVETIKLIMCLGFEVLERSSTRPGSTSPT